MNKIINYKSRYAMKYLITGATGFIGQELTKFKLDFRCVYRTSVNSPFMDHCVIPSLNELAGFDSCFRDVDAIIHLAGLAHNHLFMDDEYKSVNTDGTLSLALNAAKLGVRRFVFVSSIGVNGLATFDKPFTPKSKAAPYNAYSKSKFDAEIGLKKIAEDTGMEIVIVRPTLVYGPNAPGNFGMLTRLIKVLPVLPFGLADNRRDFIAVQNLADLLITCAAHPNAAGHTFLASESETVSTKQFTNAIAKGMGKKLIQLPIPVSLMRVAGRLSGKSAMIEQLFGNLEVDSSNIQQVLGWTPPLTMEQAMAQLNNSGK